MKASKRIDQFTNGAESARDPRILIFDLKPERAAIVAAGLGGFGNVEIRHAEPMSAFETGGDVIIISCDEPDNCLLECVSQANTRAPCPIVLFVETSHSSLAERAMQVGISAYVVDGLEERRIRPIVQLAISRFAHVQRLQAELRKARSDLAARKTIERAKGILMERNRVSEADAYDTLRRSAMEEGRTVADVASAVLSVTRLLKV